MLTAPHRQAGTRTGPPRPAPDNGMAVQPGMASVPALGRGGGETQNCMDGGGRGCGGLTRDGQEPTRDPTSVAQDPPALVVTLMGGDHGSKDRGIGQA